MPRKAKKETKVLFMNKNIEPQVKPFYIVAILLACIVNILIYIAIGGVWVDINSGVFEVPDLSLWKYNNLGVLSTNMIILRFLAISSAISSFICVFVISFRYTIAATFINLYTFLATITAAIFAYVRFELVFGILNSNIVSYGYGLYCITAAAGCSIILFVFIALVRSKSKTLLKRDHYRKQQ
jgi:hypothetical protein